MEDLSIRDDIIITKTDKGGAVVILDVDGYINEANRQLNNKEFYKEVPNDPTELNRKKVNALKERKYARLLDKNIATKLEVQEAKTLAFYMFPKLHKPENPGKPEIVPLIAYRNTSITIYNLTSKN